MRLGFSLARFWAVLAKEFVQMRRDRLTFGMMVGIPIMQLVLFGYAINTDPHNLPTLLEMNDQSPVARAVLANMETSDYFDFQGLVTGPAEGDKALRDGTANFVVVIPADFERDIVRGLSPEILVSADASDPIAVGTAMGALSGIVDLAIQQTLEGPLQSVAGSPPPFSVVAHRQFNPEQASSVNTVRCARS